jgi:hypothetical protein
MAATVWPASGVEAMSSGCAMAQLFRTMPQAANASHEEGTTVRDSKRICILSTGLVWMLVVASEDRRAGVATAAKQSTAQHRAGSGRAPAAAHAQQLLLSE